jgi:A/G-specific adenine glycosylase
MLAVPHRRGVLDPSPLPPAARDAILAWYDQRGRTLPFRGTTDPYAILVSEAMAQQTQAARAGEAWVRFMARFPTVSTLAAATPADVLREWQGLGYNRRALNLWRAARQIVEEHDGRVPADLRSLQALPGVGPYTARAVAAIAFGRPIGAVDTNVRRVLGRIVAGNAAALRASELQAVADAAVPLDRAADWTHALMDVGATFCRPRRPDCGGCPARAWCRFAAHPPAQAPVQAPPLKAAGRVIAREVRAPFAGTSRWLRGRIVDRLRAAQDGAWTVVAGPIGEHDQSAVAEALIALAREGLVELVRDDPTVTGKRARLPIS